VILGVEIYCKHTHILYSVLLPLLQTFQLLCCCSTRSILLSLVQTFQVPCYYSTRYIVLSLAQIRKLLCCCSTGNVLLSLAQTFHLLSSCSTRSVQLSLAQTISPFLLQHNVYQQAVKVPEELQDITNEETYSKARVYGLDTSSFNIVKELFSIAITVVRHYLILLCSTEMDKIE